MSVVARGIKNTARNPSRAVSVIAMLGVAISLALALLLANQAVKNKLEELKATGATLLTITPAGQAFGPGQIGGGEPLTSEMYEQIKNTEHVDETGAVLTGGGIRVMRGAGGGAEVDAPESEFDLESPLGGGSNSQQGFGSSLPDDFQIPVQSIGVSGNLDQAGNNYLLTDGTWLDEDEANNVVAGKDLAAHNGLSVGDTFEGYGRTFTVIGIYDAGDDRFRNANLLVSLATAQELNDSEGEVSTITARVDSIENIASVRSTISDTLGEDAVNVTSNSQSTEDAIGSLESIGRISVTGVVIATVAAGVIVFMTMTMVVRERKKEIAVLKAIGGSNFKIAGQFITEAVTLTVVSVAVGGLLAFALGGPLTNMLVAGNTNETSDTDQTEGLPVRGGFVGRTPGGAAGQDQTSARELIGEVRTDIGLDFLLQGLIAIVVIGALGSAIPSYAISKVRPAEVLRSE